MPATCTNISLSFLWIWPTVCFCWKLDTHRVYTHCHRYSPPWCPQSPHAGLNIWRRWIWAPCPSIISPGTCVHEQSLCFWGYVGSFGLLSSLHRSHVPAAYLGNWFLNTVLIYMGLSQVLFVNVFKGEPTKSADTAMEAPGSKSREAPKNPHSFKILKLNEKCWEIPNFIWKLIRDLF